jgi:UDP-N-acetylmuramate--alanine ligase
LRVAGKVDPVFVDDISDMPEAILDHTRAGDVVISMGAGSISAVPALVLELKQKVTP